ncbi:MAG: hypothetical protein GY851_22815 [bacterium]|nr:hypothetical protein [bacterium]
MGSDKTDGDLSAVEFRDESHRRNGADLLRRQDPDLVELPCGAGAVLVAPGLQGRIFCRIDGELVHRLDADALLNPSPTEFNNLGGNSLWPAPEGGPFAFNYLPDSDDWVVQDGIGAQNCQVTQRNVSSATIAKTIRLVNRRGTRLDLEFLRHVRRFLAFPLFEGTNLQAVGYRTVDTFEPLNPCNPDQALLAPWSLEQFPGGEGVTAFAKVEPADNAVNFDFYTHPGDRVVCRDDLVTFRLGGDDRHQIGIRAAANPTVLGALDTQRSLLMLRRTAPQPGRYFNIADNDQADGPDSAADLFSVFNGGSLGFFELETIGAMQVADGVIAPCHLECETLILKGPVADLQAFLREQEGIVLPKEAL